MVKEIVMYPYHEIFLVWLLNHVQLFATPWTAAYQASLSFTISQSFLKCPVSQQCPPTIFSSVIPFPSCPQSFPASQYFSNESTLCIRWPNYWSFSCSISPSNEYSGLMSFRIDWFDLLAVQATLNIFSSTTVWKHQFFSAQLSLWYNSHICTWLLEKP